MDDVTSCWWNQGMTGGEQKNEHFQDKESNVEMNCVTKKWVLTKNNHTGEKLHWNTKD